MEFIKSVWNVFYSPQHNAYIHDVGFITSMDQRIPDQHIQEKVSGIKKTLFTHMLVGFCGALSLFLSVRRYFPTYYMAPRSTRMSFEFLVFCGLQIAMMELALGKVRPDVQTIKYRLTMEHNPQYMEYLKEKAKEYKIKTDQALLKDVLSQEEFLNWKDLHPEKLTQRG